MSINIETIDSRNFTVNGKDVYKNIDDKLESQVPLTAEEKQALINFLNAETTEKKSASKPKLSGSSDRQMLAQLDLKIANVHRQRDILDNSKDLLSEESIKLRNYYENKLSGYIAKRDALIKDLPVRDACVINANQSAKRAASAS